jgi:hypothetical protein
MVSFRSIQGFIGRIRPVAWVAMVCGLALIVALNYTLTQLYSSLDLLRQLIVIIILVAILSITGFSALSVQGILRPKKRGR